MRGSMSHKFPYHSTPHAIYTIINKEGYQGLYKGMTPNLLKVAPSMAATFVTYEFTKSWLFGVPVRWKTNKLST